MKRFDKKPDLSNTPARFLKCVIESGHCCPFCKRRAYYYRVTTGDYKCRNCDKTFKEKGLIVVSAFDSMQSYYDSLV